MNSIVKTVLKDISDQIVKAIKKELNLNQIPGSPNHNCLDYKNHRITINSDHIYVGKYHDQFFIIGQYVIEYHEDFINKILEIMKTKI